METLKPASAGELAAMLGAASAARRTVNVRGSGSKQRMGGPPQDADVLIETAELSSVLQYDPRDLTISVEAGMPWRELAGLLAAHGQMLPLDPPCAATATVGGVVMTHSGGPRRRLYGSARDMVIGITYAVAGGRLASAGGMVVKNVAGLDVQKALIGSFGTLAVVTAVNFKLSPAPGQTRTFVLSWPDSAPMAGRRDAILRGALQPAALDALNPASARLLGLDGFCLLLRAGGPDSLIARYGRELAGAEQLSGEAEARLWSAIEEFAPSQPFVVRAAHELAALAQVLDSCPGPCIARAGTGVTYLSFESASAALAWMSAPQHARWSSVLAWSSAPAPVYWPAPGPEFEWMKKLKVAFDPQGLLNRGRLYGRL